MPAFLSLKQKCKDFNKQHIFNHKVETEISTQNKMQNALENPLKNLWHTIKFNDVSKDIITSGFHALLLLDSHLSIQF